MVLPLAGAVRSLAVPAKEKAQDPRLLGRLNELHALLADNLAFVETALLDATARGEKPGRDAARHLVSQGGKRVRPMALLLSSACFGEITVASREMAVVVELIHTATLLHDDVIDDGTERRWAAAARLLWGNAISVLAGDLLLVEALERTSKAAPQVLGSLFATLRRLVDGEIVQLRGRAELDVSRETYDAVLRGKTASLFRWATSTGARLAGATAADEESLGTFGELVGMAFQLVDDALDYTSETSKKTALADLRDGKMTLPLVLALERRPDLIDPVRRIHAGDDAPLAEVRQGVLETGACDDVRQLAAENTTRALDVIAGVQPSAARTLLENVVAELVERRG